MCHASCAARGARVAEKVWWRLLSSAFSTKALTYQGKKSPRGIRCKVTWRQQDPQVSLQLWSRTQICNKLARKNFPLRMWRKGVLISWVLRGKGKTSFELCRTHQCIVKENIPPWSQCWRSSRAQSTLGNTTFRTPLCYLITQWATYAIQENKHRSGKLFVLQG